MIECEAKIKSTKQHACAQQRQHRMPEYGWLAGGWWGGWPSFSLLYPDTGRTSFHAARVRPPLRPLRPAPIRSGFRPAGWHPDCGLWLAGSGW